MPKGRRWLLAALILLWPMGAASAETEKAVVRLAKRLSGEKDFRVRTQAALALGTTQAPAAVKPLCTALGDPSATVRAAAAAALGKLNRGGTECLKKRLASEQSARVRSSMRRALSSLDEPAEIRPETRYYVAIARAQVIGRDEAKVNAALRGSIKRAAKELGTLALAPENESVDAAASILKKNGKLAGFYLAPKVPEPKLEGGNLKVMIEVAVFKYPERALLGSFSLNLAAQVDGEDEETEMTLLKMLGERAIKKFSESAGEF